MRKRLTLMLTLLLVACLACGCAYLPLSGMDSMLSESGSAQPTPAVDGDTVTISREQYEKYQQFDKLLEMMQIVNDSYYQEVAPDDMMDGAAQGGKENGDGEGADAGAAEQK